MLGSASWFVLTAMVAIGGWLVGVYLGKNKNLAMGRLGMVVGLLMMAAWVWLIRHPAVAVRIVPLGVMSRLEGIGAVPMFMLVVGVAWGRSRVMRQKYLAGWACVLGAIYFLHGGIWMLQTTPTQALGNELDRSGNVMQTQYYTCVPAACASALKMLGIKTTEAEMAILTDTRPGTGATMLRAMHGLQQKLNGTDYEVVILEPEADQVGTLPVPMLTPLQFESTQLHMVTIQQFLPIK